MSDLKGKSPESPKETVEEQLEQVEHDAEAMDRPDRAIPLEDDEEKKGLGVVKYLVP
ncbi:hypothetical protein [Brevundimonas poindexterae]|uniref:hypothetical protein n=1 Tax=Brevundimonas poindexterae TaxID=74325 RepID=UPI001CFC5C6C|nr:hypothetical protein [Brevundimonas poindexterae]